MARLVPRARPAQRSSFPPNGGFAPSDDFSPATLLAFAEAGRKRRASEAAARTPVAPVTPLAPVAVAPPGGPVPVAQAASAAQQAIAQQNNALVATLAQQIIARNKPAKLPSLPPLPVLKTPEEIKATVISAETQNQPLTGNSELHGKSALPQGEGGSKSAQAKQEKFMQEAHATVSRKAHRFFGGPERKELEGLLGELKAAKGDAERTAEVMGKLRTLVGKHRRIIDALGEGLEEGLTAEGKRIIAALENAEAKGGNVHARTLEILAGTTVKAEREELARKDRVREQFPLGAGDGGPGGNVIQGDIKSPELLTAIASELPIIRNIGGAVVAGRLTKEAAIDLLDGKFGDGSGKLLLALVAIGGGGRIARRAGRGANPRANRARREARTQKTSLRKVPLSKRDKQILRRNEKHNVPGSPPPKGGRVVPDNLKWLNSDKGAATGGLKGHARNHPLAGNTDVDNYRRQVVATIRFGNKFTLRHGDQQKEYYIKYFRRGIPANTKKKNEVIQDVYIIVSMPKNGPRKAFTAQEFGTLDLQDSKAFRFIVPQLK